MGCEPSQELQLVPEEVTKAFSCLSFVPHLDYKRSLRLQLIRALPHTEADVAAIKSMAGCEGNEASWKKKKSVYSFGMSVLTSSPLVTPEGSPLLPHKSAPRAW